MFSNYIIQKKLWTILLMDCNLKYVKPKATHSHDSLRVTGGKPVNPPPPPQDSQFIHTLKMSFVNPPGFLKSWTFTFDHALSIKSFNSKIALLFVVLLHIIFSQKTMIMSGLIFDGFWHQSYLHGVIKNKSLDPQSGINGCRPGPVQYAAMIWSHE